MAKTSSVDLRLPLDRKAGIDLKTAEWWEPGSRFVLVRYSVRGDLQELGLRLDLDKRVFLDDFNDPVLDEKLRSVAHKICSNVAEAKKAARLAS